MLEDDVIILLMPKDVIFKNGLTDKINCCLMPYFLSFPKSQKKERFFLVVSLGPLNHVVRNVALITVELVWIKFIISCLLHKDYSLDNQKDINKMILAPDFGVYNRVLMWAFEYAERNIDPPSGVLLGRDWNYGTKAKAKNRDFFNYTGFGRFLKYILDTQHPQVFLRNAKKYSEGRLSEVSKDFLPLEKRFREEVLGINLSQFRVRDFLRNVFEKIKATHFTTQRYEFVSIFVSNFLKEFRQTSEIESSGIIQDNMLRYYIDFVTRELGIFNKKDLLEEFRRDEKSLSSIFPDPSKLEPSLSDEGYDAFLILKLMKENAAKHFYSFLISSYLKKKDENFRFSNSHKYLNIYERLKTRDFQNHIKKVGRALSKFGEFKLKLNEKLLRFLAIWWEYYQFSFIGERVIRAIHRLLLDNYKPDEIREIVDQYDLVALTQFMNTYLLHSDEYIDALRRDENFEQILIQLDEISELGSKPNPNSIYEYLFKKANSQIKKEPARPPFFPSMDSFELWVDKLIKLLKIT